VEGLGSVRTERARTHDNTGTSGNADDTKVAPQSDSQPRPRDRNPGKVLRSKGSVYQLRVYELEAQVCQAVAIFVNPLPCASQAWDLPPSLRTSSSILLQVEGVFRSHRGYFVVSAAILAFSFYVENKPQAVVTWPSVSVPSLQRKGFCCTNLGFFCCCCFVFFLLCPMTSV
jgi:hypothetical protein